MAYIIGIDIGTTNTKAVAFTDESAVLASAEISYTAISPQPDYHELDPITLFDGVISVLKKVIQATSGIPGLAGISFSAAMHSLIAVDKDGQLLTRAITWADLRSRSYADALKGSVAGKRIYKQTGTPIHPMSPLCKLLWLKDKEPELFGKAALFISIKEYIWWRLFGKYQVDHSIASATGLFDIYTLDWYAESLELAGIVPGQLSMSVPSTHTESILLPGSLEGLPQGLPFIIGGSDGCLANLGSLALKSGDTALTIGTSGAIRMTAAAPKYDPQERIFNYVLTDSLYISGGATNNGGGVLDWFVHQFPGPQNLAGSGGPGPAGGTHDLTAEAEKVEPGSGGLVFLPYLRGERAPIWDAKARGVFFGIRADHTHAHFMRAVMEGISFSLFEVGASLENTIGPIQHIYASGGFTRSTGWLQMIADVFNRRVSVTNVADASAIGAVILGFYALGLIPDMDAAARLIRVQDTYEPDGDRHRVYQQNFAVYTALYDRLKDLM